jgi:hypothetical protein
MDTTLKPPVVFASALGMSAPVHDVREVRNQAHAI